ncbi:MAG: hypothetical protein G01um101470_461 [Parcubacteria group bacterium Gr01-1014_70]|nr:MAG: hypothetical protein G01um101470_461 [Parcubacteria group bacterium Gr01-1014_70]
MKSLENKAICPFCDNSTIEERGKHVYCGACSVFLCETDVLPKLSASSLVSALRHRENMFSLSETDRVHKQAELQIVNERWYGFLFTALLGLVSLASLGVL